MNYTREDIDQFIKSFHNSPCKDIYMTVKEWYENNVEYYPDEEYIICVYLFLLGANQRHLYTKMDKRTYMDCIKEIRDLIERTDSFKRPVRKVYLDCGLKN